MSTVYPLFVLFKCGQPPVTRPMTSFADTYHIRHRLNCVVVVVGVTIFYTSLHRPLIKSRSTKLSDTNTFSMYFLGINSSWVHARFAVQHREQNAIRHTVNECIPTNRQLYVVSLVVGQNLPNGSVCVCDCHRHKAHQQHKCVFHYYRLPRCLIL